MMTKEKILNIISILVVTILTCMSIAFLYTYTYVDTLESEIQKRDLIIENLNRKDSLNQSIIGNSKLTLNKTNVVSSGNLVKYANEMSNLIDSLYNVINSKHKELNNLNDTLRYYKIYFDFNQKSFNHKYIVKRNASGGRNYSFESNAVSKSELKKCQEEASNLLKEINEINKTHGMFKEAIKKYGIKFKNLKNRSENGSYIMSFETYSPSIDSALMLLPVYGNKLKYNSKNNEWSVGGKMYIRYITTDKDSTK